MTMNDGIYDLSENCKEIFNFICAEKFEQQKNQIQFTVLIIF